MDYISILKMDQLEIVRKIPSTFVGIRTTQTALSIWKIFICG